MKQVNTVGVLGLMVLVSSPLTSQTRAPRTAELEALRAKTESELAAVDASRQGTEASRAYSVYRLAQVRNSLEQLSAWGRYAPATPAPPVRPAEYFPADSADDLFRQARVELRRRNYEEAVDLFRTLRNRFPDSRYVPQAMYYEAFSLQRIGGEDNMRRALEILDLQIERYPDESRDASSLRIQVLGALGRRGDAAAAAEIAARAEQVAGVQAVPAPRAEGEVGVVVVPGPVQEDDDVRMQALNALLQMDAGNAIPILKRVLQNRRADNVGLRRRAIFLVSQKRSDEREEILLDAVRNDPDDEVKQQAVFFLSQVRTDAAVDALDSILQNATDERIQERAVFALSQHRSERAGQILRDYVRRTDVPTDLRARAIQSLGQRRDNTSFLRDLYGELQDPDLRAQVMFAVSQTRDPENAQFLIGIAADETAPMDARKRAIFWAGQMRVARSELVGLYDRTEDIDFKEQLLFVYGQSRDSSAVTKLIDVARNETNPRLQSRAIFWLGQSRDPRAVTVLEEIINRGRI